MQSWLNEAMRLHRSGRIPEAVALYRRFLTAEPGNVPALCSLALAHFQAGQINDAERHFGQAIALEPNSPDALCFRGVARMQLARRDDALSDFEAALSIKPNFAAAMSNRATALLELGRPAEALAAFDSTLAIEPGHVEAWVNRGNALVVLERFEEAISSYDQALALQANRAETWFNRGNALCALKRLSEACASYDRAVAANPSYAQAWFARGQVLSGIWRFADAAASFARASECGAPPTAVLPALAEALSYAGRNEEAIAAGEKLLSLDPNAYCAAGNLLSWKQCVCDWRSLENDRQRVLDGIRAGRIVSTPWSVITCLPSAADHLTIAKLWAAQYGHTAPPAARKTGNGKIRIAYLSADFRVHVTAYLMAGVFGSHDRERFETFAVSFGKPETSGMRTRLEESFDRFLDVREKSDGEVVDILRAHEIDIAIDLKGYTTDSRPGILARRPAPVQVSYLGFPGSMGADFIDYLIADSTVVPEGHEQFFSEKIARIRGSYYPFDGSQALEPPPSRGQAGLPENGFVFACFNNSSKFTPEIFDVWMELLKAVPGSVLWLIDCNKTASANLRREAGTRGVSAERLIFAPFLPNDKHIARQALADLFLDTAPFNAHTTAANALWAGLPVLTVAGEGFAGRVAASILGAVGLPELVANSLKDYQSRALALAKDAGRLAAIRTKLAAARSTSGFFDGTRMARHLEAAYQTMWERCQAGEKPRTFNVRHT